MPLPIIWAPVLQKAAEAFASSFFQRLGDQLGGPTGAAIADAIFGGSAARDAAWQEEVVGYLTRIEQKIDQIVEFINTRLPALVYSEVTKALLDQRVNDLKSSRVAIAAALSAYSANPSDGNKQALRNAADRAADMGYSLIQNGPVWHAAGIAAFTAATSAYMRLIEADRSLVGAFSTWAKSYADVTEPWLNPTVNRSIAEVLNSSQDTLAHSRHVLSQVPVDRFLMVVFAGPFQQNQPGYQPPAPGSPAPAVNEAWLGMPGWIHRHPNGAWTGDWGGGQQRYVHVPVGTQMTPEVFVGAFGPLYPPWALLDFARPPVAYTHKDNMHPIFASALAQVTLAQSRVDTLPESIHEVEVAKASVVPFVKGCKEIASLPNLAL